MGGVKQKSKFALVWWLSEKSISIISTNVIARKYQKVNEIVNLVWQDKIKKTKSAEKAKILAIGDYNELEEMNVDSNGNIYEKTQKLLSPIKDERKKIGREKQKVFKKKSKKASRRSISISSTDTVESSSSSSKKSESYCGDNKSIKNVIPEKTLKLAQQHLFPNGVTVRDIENVKNYLRVIEKIYELQLKKGSPENVFEVTKENPKLKNNRVSLNKNFFLKRTVLIKQEKSTKKTRVNKRNIQQSIDDDDKENTIKQQKIDNINSENASAMVSSSNNLRDLPSDQELSSISYTTETTLIVPNMNQEKNLQNSDYTPPAHSYEADYPNQISHRSFDNNQSFYSQQNSQTSVYETNYIENQFYNPEWLADSIRAFNPLLSTINNNDNDKTINESTNNHVLQAL